MLKGTTLPIDLPVTFVLPNDVLPADLAHAVRGGPSRLEIDNADAIKGGRRTGRHVYRLVSCHAGSHNVLRVTGSCTAFDPFLSYGVDLPKAI